MRGSKVSPALIRPCRHHGRLSFQRHVSPPDGGHPQGTRWGRRGTAGWVQSAHPASEADRLAGDAQPDASLAPDPSKIQRGNLRASVSPFGKWVWTLCIS